MKKYDLVVIGGGVGGLISSIIARSLDAKVAMIEKEKNGLGGDCLLYGCVPTKSLVSLSKNFHNLHKYKDLFSISHLPELDFKKVMDEMRKRQALIAENDDPERFKEMGIDVIFGKGSFTDENTFKVNDEELKSKKFIIATGTRPAMPDYKGLKEIDPLTNVSVLQLEKKPKSLIIIGSGPIAVEYVQIFARLKTKVTIIMRGTNILKKEEKELTDKLEEKLKSENISIIKNCKIEEFSRIENQKQVITDKGNFAADDILIATGREPNTEGLNLEKANVEYSKKGIKVNDYLRTTNKNIYAVGDVTGGYLFTHVAEYEAGIACLNALLPLARRADYRVTPWVTYTDPELARVGMTEEEATAKFGKNNILTFDYDYKDNDRAITDDSNFGMIKLVTDKKLRLLGAHILAPNAGELISEYSLLMKLKGKITDISATIHPYPTLSQGVKRVADSYYSKYFSKGIFTKIAKWIVKKKK